MNGLVMLKKYLFYSLAFIIEMAVDTAILFGGLWLFRDAAKCAGLENINPSIGVVVLFIWAVRVCSQVFKLKDFDDTEA